MRFCPNLLGNGRLLSTAKRKDALPDPAKINPLLLKRVSEVTQKATAKNGNKTDVAEAVTRPVDRTSLSIKGQPTSGVAVSGSTFHCSVEQVVGGGNFWKTAQTKGSDRGSATSILQFSEPVQHNSDDVMTSIPADYGSRELVQLLELVRQSFPGEFTWRHVRWEDLAPPMRWRCRGDPYRDILILHRLAGHGVG